MNKLEKQKPFKIDMTMPTSEMLGRSILEKLETTQAWVVPIYENDVLTKVDKQGRPDREKIAKHLCDRDAGCGKHWDNCVDNKLKEFYLEEADQILALFNEEAIRKDEGRRVIQILQRKSLDTNRLLLDRQELYREIDPDGSIRQSLGEGK